MAKKFYYGGQAVIEGVMMRGQKTAVTAVRKPNDEVALNVKQLSTIYTGWMRKTPLIRGIVVLLEALVLGMQSLLYSANVSLEEEEETISGWLTWVLVTVSLVFAVALFFVVPLFLTKLFDPHISSSLVFHR